MTIMYTAGLSRNGRLHLYDTLWCFSSGFQDSDGHISRQHHSLSLVVMIIESMNFLFILEFGIQDSAYFT